jgi:hypothetical protein
MKHRLSVFEATQEKVSRGGGDAMSVRANEFALQEQLEELRQGYAMLEALTQGMELRFGGFERELQDNGRQMVLMEHEHNQQLQLLWERIDALQADKIGMQEQMKDVVEGLKAVQDRQVHADRVRAESGSHAGTSGREHPCTNTHAAPHMQHPNTNTHTWGPLNDELVAAIGYETHLHTRTFKLDHMVPYSAGQDAIALAHTASQALKSYSNYKDIVVTRAHWAAPQRQGGVPSRLFVHVKTDEDVKYMNWLMGAGRLAHHQHISQELGPVELAIYRVTMRDFAEWQYMNPQHAHTMHMHRCAVVNNADGVTQNFSPAAVAAGLEALAKVRQARPTKHMTAAPAPMTAATKK